MAMEPTRSRESRLHSISSSKALMGIRIIWLALLLGQLAFMAVVFLLILPNASTRRGLQPQPALSWVPFLLLVTVVPAAFFMRRLILRRSTTAAGIRPAAFSTGNIVFWATCEGCAFFGLIAIMINGKLWPTIIAVAIALFLQALTFPTGAGISFSDETGVQGNG